MISVSRNFEAPFRVFRYAPASPFHLTRYETKQHKPVPSGPTKGINKTNKKLATKRRPLHCFSYFEDHRRICAADLVAGSVAKEIK
jgi:hypothetical protein